eukprot:7434520-Lingulodinium_polyedra.AAC.1
MAATLRVLSQRNVSVRVLRRLVGKGSFIQAYRVCLRSLFQEVYWVLEAFPDRGRHVVELKPGPF